jgi:hypothetical protein
VAQGLYPAVLGSGFDALAPAVRAFHSGGKALRARGVFRVEHGNWLARIVVRLLGFPPAGDAIDLRLAVEVTENGERWRRSFGGVAMVSEQWRDGPHLVERLGTTQVRFVLEADGGALVFRQVSVATRLGSLVLPMPRFLAASVSARVVEEDGALRSDIVLRAPLIGLLIRYGGRLELEP